MDDHGFQYAISRYVSYVMEYNSKKVLIDLSNFKFSPGEASGQFYTDYVIKIYNLIDKSNNDIYQYISNALR